MSTALRRSIRNTPSWMGIGDAICQIKAATETKAERHEFDLDAAIARRPHLVLVDELAHRLRVEPARPCRGGRGRTTRLRAELQGDPVRARRRESFPCRRESFTCRGESLSCRRERLSCRRESFTCRRESFPCRGESFPCRGGMTFGRGNAGILGGGGLSGRASAPMRGAWRESGSQRVDSSADRSMARCAGGAAIYTRCAPARWLPTVAL